VRQGLDGLDIVGVVGVAVVGADHEIIFAGVLDYIGKIIGCLASNVDPVIPQSSTGREIALLRANLGKRVPRVLALKLAFGLRPDNQIVDRIGNPLGSCFHK